MSTRHTLSEAIEQYMVSRRSQFAENTIKGDDRCLRTFLAITGNIQVGQISPSHVDHFFVRRSATLQASSLNTELAILRSFFKWCRLMKFISHTSDPTGGRGLLKENSRAHLLIPSSEFSHLLDCASHPRDRIIVAIGLYLFLRQGEISTLRIQDVDLDRGEVSVSIHKTKKRDIMPICEELDDELRRWLTYYSSDAEIPLEGGHWLCPAKGSAPFTWDGGVRTNTRATLRPTSRYLECYMAAQRAVRQAGYPAKWEGGHTLRRSGARALYDQLAEKGHDGAMRHVQAMLHHANLSMTEHYLGIDLDTSRRNTLLKGKRMFEVEGTNVVQLRKAD